MFSRKSLKFTQHSDSSVRSPLPKFRYKYLTPTKQSNDHFTTVCALIGYWQNLWFLSIDFPITSSILFRPDKIVWRLSGWRHSPKTMETMLPEGVANDPTSRHSMQKHWLMRRQFLIIWYGHLRHGTCLFRDGRIDCAQKFILSHLFLDKYGGIGFCGRDLCNLISSKFRYSWNISDAKFPWHLCAWNAYSSALLGCAASSHLLLALFILLN